MCPTTPTVTTHAMVKYKSTFLNILAPLFCCTHPPIQEGYATPNIIVAFKVPKSLVVLISLTVKLPIIAVRKALCINPLFQGPKWSYT
jgi:hypothetical protein